MLFIGLFSEFVKEDDEPLHAKRGSDSSHVKNLSTLFFPSQLKL